MLTTADAIALVGVSASVAGTLVAGLKMYLTRNQSKKNEDCVLDNICKEKSEIVFSEFSEIGKSLASVLSKIETSNQLLVEIISRKGHS